MTETRQQPERLKQMRTFSSTSHTAGEMRPLVKNISTAAHISRIDGWILLPAQCESVTKFQTRQHWQIADPSGINDNSRESKHGLFENIDFYSFHIKMTQKTYKVPGASGIFTGTWASLRHRYWGTHRRLSHLHAIPSAGSRLLHISTNLYSNPPAGGRASPDLTPAPLTLLLFYLHPWLLLSLLLLLFPFCFTFFFLQFSFWPSCPKALLRWLVPDVPLSSSCRLNIPQLETAHTLKHTLLLTPSHSPFPLDLSPTHRAKKSCDFFFPQQLQWNTKSLRLKWLQSIPLSRKTEMH